MKKALMLSLIIVGLLSAGWMRVVGSSDSPLPPEKMVMKSDTSEVFIRTETFGFIEEDTTIDEKNFKRIEIPEEQLQQMYDDTTIVGKPQMPYIKLLIAVPDSCEFEITAYPSDYTTFDNYLMYPVPRIVFETDSIDTFEYLQCKEIFTYDTSFYEKDTLYPGKFYEVRGNGYWRNQRVLEIFLYPVQFNPHENAMYFYHGIDLRIEYTGEAYENTRGLGPFEDIGREILLNYPLPSLGTMGISPPPQIPPSVHYYDSLQQNNVADYIIVTHGDFLANETTAYWINELGWQRVHHNNFDVGVVAMSDVYDEFLEQAQGDSAKSLRDFLVYAFDNWRAPHISDSSFAYCLFIGDWDYVPAKLLWVYYPVVGDSFFNAYEGYFRDIDSTDLNDPSYEDIMLGRWPVKERNSADLVGVAQKTINYEADPDTGYWRRRGLLIGGSGEGYYENIDPNVVAAIPYFRDIEYDTIALRDHLFPQHPDSSHMDDSVHKYLNCGEIIAAYYGHGGPYGWAIRDHGYGTGRAQYLANGDSLPVILSYACRPGLFQFDHPVFDSIYPGDTIRTCFGECVLQNTGGGAVAFFGAASPLYMGCYNTQPIERVLRYQHWILGKALVCTYPNDIANCFCLLGDPALDPGDYTAFPNLPDLVIPSGGVGISIMTPHPYHTGGDIIPIRAKLYNVGGATVNNLDVKFAVLKSPSDTTYRDIVNIPEILPRDTAIAISYWNTSLTHPGEYGEVGNTIWAEADPENVIIESWEHNNKSSKTEKIVLYPNESGWPKKLFRPYSTETSQPALANLDETDNAEIVYGCADSIYVFKNDGTNFEGWPQCFHNITGIVVGDLDCMGNPEIVAISQDSIKAYDYQGSVLWRQEHPDTLPNYLSGMPAMGYVSGADKREVVVFNLAKFTTPKVLLYGYNGNLLRVFSAADTANGFSSSWGPAISDVNGDGMEEIVLSYATYPDNPGRTNYYGTDLFNITSNIPIDTLANIGNAFSIPALVDLDDPADGFAELITSRYNTNIMAYRPRNSTILWQTETYGAINSSPAAGDIRSGVDFPGNEIAFGNDSCKIWAVRGYWGDPWFPYPLFSGGIVRISPALASLDTLDGVDIVIASNDWNVVALNYLGDTIAPYPLPVHSNLSSPVVGDIDGDGKSETVIVTGEGYLHVWENINSEIPRNLLEWPQFHHDYQRTGQYNWIGGFSGGDANPQVFSTATTISFSLKDTSSIQVKIYDTQGNVVKTLINQILPKGSYHPVWDGKNNNYTLLPNGLYFIEFKVRNERKVIPVRIRR